MHTYKQRLEEKFKAEYARLNPAQQKAVDTIEGPVMVIAGPGTGKTQILAARIGKILLDTDALPENILCLTYTDAGTIAMRRRLVTFMGADAYKVNIHTFHSFCNDVIQDNLGLFDKHSLDPVSELESIQLFKQLIDDFPKNHPLKRYRGDVYYEINNLKQLFSIMKREGWSPEKIIAAIDAYIIDLPCRDEYVYKKKYKEFNAGDLKKDKYDDECNRMEKLRAAVNEFPRFQEMMRQRNRYDFDDMINWVINVFENNPGVLSSYQEKYQYILVDEYQDTSGTQNRLVELLISYWDNPNVFVVGDDDQSIYRFQGANVENMLAFANAYTKDLFTVVLTNNYRSTQPILDISKTLIDRNDERLVRQLPDLSKDLVASHSEISLLTHSPLVSEYQTAKAEMADITYKIEALLQEGVEPGNIAVIYRENKYGSELAGYFRVKNIPYYSKRNLNILDDPFAKKVITILRYINAEHDIPYGGDEMLFEILHYDFYKIPPIETAKLTVEVNNKKYDGEIASIRRLLVEKANSAPATLFDKGPHEGFRIVSRIIEGLIADVPNVTLQKLFENVLTHAGVLSYVIHHPEKIRLMQLLTGMFDFIKDETSRNPSLNLEGLVNIIDLMEREGIPLPLSQISGNEHGVNLLTVHGSKGLEFEYVFVCGMNSAFWEKKKANNRGYRMPDTLFSSQPAGRDVEELRRLFYVALTRAQKHLHISYANFRNDGKELEPSMFIAEIQEQHNLLVAKKTFNEEEYAEFDMLQLIEKPVEIEKAEEDFISALLDKFVMNVTALNNYLKCPLNFYYNSLVRIPSGKNESTEFGSAIHFALERFFKRYAGTGDESNPTIPPGKEDLIADFKWYIQRHRENFTKEAYARRLEQGEDVLSNYFDKYNNTWNRIVVVERNIRGVVMNGVPLKGKLDKLEFTGKDVNVVDYKTGNVDNAKEKLFGPSDKLPNGGDYWRQAVFYKLLVDNYAQKEWKVVSTEFDFIEPDKKKEFQKIKIVIEPLDTETVKQQITEVYSKIMAKDFYTGCGKEDCHWCNFAKANNLVLEIPEQEEQDI